MEDAPGELARPLEQADASQSQPSETAAYQFPIPPPPAPTLFNTKDDLVKFLQDFYKLNGAALVKKNSSNYREIDGKSIPHSFYLHCDRGPSHPSTSKGIRRVSSHKLNCPFRLGVSSRKSDDWKWTYRVLVGEHNHPRSAAPSAHVMHRKRTQAETDLLAVLSKHRIAPAKIKSIMEDYFPGTHSSIRDLYNDRQKARRQALANTAP